MPEIKTKVDTYMIDFVCEKCKEGRLMHVPGLPPKPGIQKGDVLYAHVCSNPKCKQLTPVKNKRYPYPVYELPQGIKS